MDGAHPANLEAEHKQHDHHQRLGNHQAVGTVDPYCYGDGMGFLGSAAVPGQVDGLSVSSDPKKKGHRQLRRQISYGAIFIGVNQHTVSS